MPRAHPTTQSPQRTDLERGHPQHAEVLRGRRIRVLSMIRGHRSVSTGEAVSFVKQSSGGTATLLDADGKIAEVTIFGARCRPPSRCRVTSRLSSACSPGNCAPRESNDHGMPSSHVPDLTPLFFGNGGRFTHPNLPAEDGPEMPGKARQLAQKRRGRRPAPDPARTRQSDTSRTGREHTS